MEALSGTAKYERRYDTSEETLYLITIEIRGLMMYAGDSVKHLEEWSIFHACDKKYIVCRVASDNCQPKIVESNVMS